MFRQSPWLGLFLAVWVCGASAQLASFTFSSPRLEVAEGKLRGKYMLTRENKRVRAFLGIPYAKPPVGDLRFKSPEPSDPWEGEQWAVDHPKPCVQAEQRHGEPMGKEDCLYLNVYAPENIEKRLLSQKNLTDTGNTTKVTETKEVETKANEIMSNEIPNVTKNSAVVDGNAGAGNATIVNGTIINGIIVNGTMINGTIVNGTIVNGTMISGTIVNGTMVNGTILYGTMVNCTIVNGTMVDGTIVNGTMVNSTIVNATVSNGNDTKGPLPPKLCLPVMVFFHGGGFETGRSEPFTHEYLLDADIVLVTVQYRLGLLGFLSTGDEVLPGNLGFKDQRLALQWVKKNIEHFGGCPEKITIFGDGAGGASVHYHMLFSPPKNESFRAGISMSGTALSPWAFRPPSEVAHMVERIAKIGNCPRDSEAFRTCMGYKRADDFVWILQKYKNETLGGCGEWALSLPVLGGVMEDCHVEDAFITANPWDKKVSLPWMVGVTSKEMLYEFTPQLVDRRDRLFDQLDRCFNDTLPNALSYTFSNASAEHLAEHVRNFYFKDEPISRDILGDLVDAVSDGLVVYPTFEAVRRSARRSTWLYYFNYIGSNTYGASALDGRIAPGRGDDLFFFFPRPLGKNVPRKTKEPDSVMSKKIVNLWTNFAVNLDPTPFPTEDGVKWAAVTPSTTFLNIGQSVMVIERPFFSYRMNFWSMESFPHREDDYGNGPCEKTEPIEGEEPDADAVSDVLPHDFYPALKWTLKNGWKPLVDTVEDLKDDEVEVAEDNKDDVLEKAPVVVSNDIPDDFYPALRWTLKRGWKPLVDKVEDLKGDEVEVVEEVEDVKDDVIEEEPTVVEVVTDIPDDSFYPALRWTLKSGWKPMVDPVEKLKDSEE